jgi:hypothetical protein
MAQFKLPLSGDVNVEVINPVTWFSSGNPFSANVDLGDSGAPEVEAEILDRVGTYGRQLGQIIDVITVLLERIPAHAALTLDDREAILAFAKIAGEVADIKKKHGRQAMRPSAQMKQRLFSLESADGTPPSS